jgi:hypothetical protein
MKAELQQLGQMTLEKSIWFDAQALDRGREVNSIVAAAAEPAATETSLPQWKARVLAASATTTEPQETKLQPEPTVSHTARVKRSAVRRGNPGLRTRITDQIAIARSWLFVGE